MPLDYFNRPARDDLKLILGAFREDRIMRIPAHLVDQCRYVRRKPGSWMERAPVLAVSIGGTETSAMLAERNEGYWRVFRAGRTANPETIEHFEAFLDRFLLGEPYFRQSLASGAVTKVGFSLAVPLIQGVPCHPSKLATFGGLVCKDMSDPDPSLAIAPRFAIWLERHGFPRSAFACEGDAPLAHLGGICTARMDTDDRSLLAVVGTGLGLADDREFILPSMYQILCELDPVLFPPDLCEGGQYQYQIAGKGIYKVFRRAVELEGSEPGSPLRDCPLDWIETPADSRLVFHLWANRLSDPALDGLEERVGKEAFAALVNLAGRVAVRGCRALAAAIVATLARAGNAPSGRGHVVFFEGSIMRNRKVFELFSAEVRMLLAEKAIFEHFGYDNPFAPDFRLERELSLIGENEDIEVVDLSLIGAATLAALSRGVPRGGRRR